MAGKVNLHHEMLDDRASQPQQPLPYLAGWSNWSIGRERVLAGSGMSAMWRASRGAVRRRTPRPPRG